MLAASLAVSLITVPHKSKADGKRQRVSVILAIQPNYQYATNYDGNLYLAVSDLVIEYVSASPGAPQVPVGASLATVQASLKEAGLRFERVGPWNKTEVWGN